MSIKRLMACVFLITRFSILLHFLQFIQKFKCSVFLLQKGHCNIITNIILTAPFSLIVTIINFLINRSSKYQTIKRLLFH